MSSLERVETAVVIGVLLLSFAGLSMRLVVGEPLPSAADRAVFDALAARALVAPESVDEVTVVLVDDESLLRLGENWPISRSTWAWAIRVVSSYGAAAVGLDAWFETPAPTEASDLALDLADRLRFRGLDLVPGGDIAVQELEDMALSLDGDLQFSAALAQAGNVVLGAVCVQPDADTLTLPQNAQLPTIDTSLEPALRCQHVATSVPVLATSARSEAGLRVLHDPDDAIRRYPLVFGVDSEVHPTMALELSRLARPKLAATLLDGVPPDSGAAPLMYPVSREAFRTVRFSDMLEAPSESAALHEAFAGRIVLFGVSAAGTQDYVRTGQETALPGVYVHAAAVWNLMQGRWLLASGLPGRAGSGAGALLLLGLAVIGARARRASWILVGGFGLALGWVAVAAMVLRLGVVLPVVPVVGGALAWTGVRIGFELLRGGAARQQAREIRRMFDQYLAPAVVEELVRDPQKLRLGGSRREITAFFSDVKGFTGISESLEPSELIALLNDCLGQMTDLLLAEGGTIDKYIGDAIVAMYGAPVSVPDHAARACRSAWECQRMLKRLRATYRASGRPELYVRIGLNSGPAVVGNMGSEQRFDYTMLGDTVNLAARLEGTNSAYGTDILVGEGTERLARDAILFRELDLVRVKGKLKPIRVFEVLCPIERATMELDEVVEVSAKALAAWRGRRWAEAREAFESLGEDDPWARTFLERLDVAERDPPGEDWDGVFVMTTKG